MQINEKGLELIKKYEGFKGKPYLCPAGVWTIGYGSTFYPDGRKITSTDPEISLAQATELLMNTLVSFERGVSKRVKQPLNQNKFSALVSFAFNLGLGNLENSTLLKKVNANPNDPSIKDEFMKWNKANKKVLKGLTLRRESEAELYFS